MATITLKSIPDDLYDQLKALAASNRRSVNGEIIWLIEQRLRPRRVSAEALIARARALRSAIDGPPLQIEQIDAARREGRP